MYVASMSNYRVTGSSASCVFSPQDAKSIIAAISSGQMIILSIFITVSPLQGFHWCFEGLRRHGRVAGNQRYIDIIQFVMDFFQFVRASE